MAMRSSCKEREGPSLNQLSGLHVFLEAVVLLNHLSAGIDILFFKNSEQREKVLTNFLTEKPWNDQASCSLTEEAPPSCSTCRSLQTPLNRPESALPSSSQMARSCPNVTLGWSFITKSEGGSLAAALNTCRVKTLSLQFGGL